MSPSALSPHRTEVLAYCGMPHVAYFNFNVRSKQYDVLKTHDFSWSGESSVLPPPLQSLPPSLPSYSLVVDTAEHCRSLLARYLPGAGEVLSAKFEHTFNLTYHQFASSRDAVDTFPFRKSVWCDAVAARGGARSYLPLTPSLVHAAAGTMSSACTACWTTTTTTGR